MPFGVHELEELARRQPLDSEIEAGRQFVELWTRVHGMQKLGVLMSSRFAHGGLLVTPKSMVSRAFLNRPNREGADWNSGTLHDTDLPFVVEAVRINPTLQPGDPLLPVTAQSRPIELEGGRGQVKFEYEFDLAAHHVALLEPIIDLDGHNFLSYN